MSVFPEGMPVPVDSRETQRMEVWADGEIVGYFDRVVGPDNYDLALNQALNVAQDAGVDIETTPVKIGVHDPRDYQTEAEIAERDFERHHGGKARFRDALSPDEGLHDWSPPQTRTLTAEEKTGRNAPCWCGSGLKFKRCHGDRPAEEPAG